MISTVQEIERSIENLSPHEMVQFRNWFEEFDARQWDEQFEEDANSGRLDKIAEKSIAGFKEGKVKRL